MSAQESSGQVVPIALHSRRVEIPPPEVLVGKDVLELITAAMYVDPLSIYREYVQNAADSIDDGRERGLLSIGEAARVDITLDLDTRTVRIRDNGVSIPNLESARRLLAIGASAKRGTNRRGFRGIGRLAALGYCQELVFRGRAEGERSVFEVSWDARALRQALQTESSPKHLTSTIQAVTRINDLSGEVWPRRFFEVELRKVIRIKNDILLNPEVVSAYLAQISPVPFKADFKLHSRIVEFLGSHGIRDPFEITVNGGGPIRRPFLSSFEVTPRIREQFKNVTFMVIPGIDGGTDAVGWVLDHGYHGAFPRSAGLGGLRVRSGDMQVGDCDILAELFVEPRFNSWVVGEFHILTSKIIPNGRRDNFECNAHYANFQSHVTRLATELTRTCRTRSNTRRLVRTFNERIANYEADLPLIRSIPHQLAFRAHQLAAMVTGLEQCERRLTRVELPESQREELETKLIALNRRVERAKKQTGNQGFLGRLPATKRKVYAEVLSAIYESVPDFNQAHETVLHLIKRKSARRRKTK